MAMAGICLGTSAILILMGIGSYFGSGAVSMTALIPAFFGIPLLLFGLVARSENPKARMHAMHGAAVVGLVGALGGLGMGLPKIPKLLDHTAERPLAVIMQIAMGIVCVVFVALCVRSFIAVRRNRRAGGEK
jgi:hypothetical protein